MLAFALYQWVRYKFAITGSLQGLPYSVTALELVELYFIACIAMHWRSRQLSAVSAFGLLDAAIVFAVITAIMVTAGRPIVAATFLSLMLLVLVIRDRQLLFLAIALMLFLGQYNPIPSLFLIFRPLGHLDALAVQSMLAAFGYVVTLHGTVVLRPEIGFGVDVTTSCTSAQAVVIVMAGYWITVMGMRGRVVKSDFAVAGWLALLTIAMNIARLGPTSLSPEGHAFWHDGAGADIFSAIYVVTVLGAAYYAVYRVQSHQ